MIHTNCEIVNLQIQADKNNSRQVSAEENAFDLFLNGGFEQSSESSIEAKGDVGPAVKIWGRDYHPCSKHCVFVCQRLILSLTSHLYILSRHPPLSALAAQIHSVRSGGVQQRLHVFHLDNSALPIDSQGCGLYIYLESSARLPQKELRATRDLTKR